MKPLILLAGAATLAIATAATAGPGGNHGGGGPRGGGAAAVRVAGGGGGGGGRAAARVAFAAPRAAAGGGARMQARSFAPRAFAARAGGGAHVAVQRPQQVNRPAFAQRAQAQVRAREVAQVRQRQVQANRVQQARVQMAQAQHARVQQAQAQQRVQAQMAQRQQIQANRQVQMQNQMAARQQIAANRQLQMQNQMAARAQLQSQQLPQVNNPVGYGAGGCPPGLAKKAVACVPPGLAAKLAPTGIGTAAATAAILAPTYASQFVGQPLPVVTQTVPLAPLPAALETIYPATPQYYYQYGDGYVYQVDRTSQLVNALMPLFGLGYTVGQPLPVAYADSYLPPAYQPFYPQSPYADYSYADGYVYQVDPMTGMITDVIPSLGYGYGVGQMLPASYSAYNLPYQYRPLYADTSDYYYRYAPGAIYQVNPTSGLIQAVVALLTGGLTVGQPLPTGYDVYNVPMDYRAQYYDTPNTWYRYANGDIYAVDPNTGLVTGVVQTVV